MLFVPAVATGVVLEVPSEFNSIGAALRSASEGDTVLVAPGDYRGPDNRNLDSGGKDVVVRSRAGPAATRIDCEGRGRGFIFDDGQTRRAVVEGFTVAGGRSYSGGGGILVRGSAPQFIDCIVRDCVAETGFGGGVLVDSHSAPRFTRCRVEGNRVLGKGDSAGGGIACHWFSSPEIEDSVIRDNHAVDGGGMACLDFSSPVIRRTRVVENVAGVGAGGIYCFYSSSPVIRETEISRNTAGGIGGGLRCRDLSEPRIVECVIADNVAGRFGGGFQAFLAAPLLTDTQVVGNWSGFDGGGVHASGGSSFVMDGCLIAGNGAARAGGGLWCDASTIGIWSSEVYGGCDPGAPLIPEPVRVEGALLAWGTERGEGSLTYDPWKGEPVLLRCEIGKNEAAVGPSLWTRVDGGAYVKDSRFWSCRPSTAWLDEIAIVPCPAITPAWDGRSMSSRPVDSVPLEDEWFEKRQRVPCIPASTRVMTADVGWHLTSGWVERFGDHASDESVKNSDDAPLFR